jgi:hypothetical protein
MEKNALDSDSVNLWIRDRIELKCWIRIFLNINIY